MRDLEAEAYRSDRAGALGQIAALVGCSVEALSDGRGRPDLREILELMSLWPSLPAQARANLIETARKAAGA